MSNFYASHPEGPPPSYEEIAQAIQKFVEENPKKSQQAITSALRKDDKSFLVDQVKDIAATVASTKASFETVSLSLIRIDGLNIHGGPRRAKWIVIYDKFKVLINLSKDEAVLGKAYADSYLQKVVAAAKDNSLSIDDRLAEIDGFIESVTQRAASAKDFKQGFLEIRDQVKVFAEQLGKDVESTETEYGDKIASLKNQIEELEEKLAKWENMSNSCLGFLGAGVGILGAGVGVLAAAAIVWCPTVRLT